MDKDNKIAKWEKRTRLPRIDGKSIIHLLGFINQAELLVSNSKNTDKLYTYNTDTNQLKKILDLPNEFDISVGGTAYNTNKKIFYLLYYGSLYIHDFQNNSFEIVTNVRNTEEFPIATVANGTFHVFGGGGSNSHFIWDKENKKFIEIHVFDELDDTGIYASHLIHVKSRNSLLLMGLTSTWQQSYNSIFEYSLDSGKWMKLNVLIPETICHDFGYVITRNDQFILMFAPYNDNHQRTDLICVLDVKHMKLGKSRIKCPVTNSFYGRVFIENQHNMENVITVGYIKSVWKQEQNFSIGYPPQYISNLVQSYYAIDYVHAINGTNHWRMPVEHIINHINFNIP